MIGFLLNGLAVYDWAMRFLLLIPLVYNTVRFALSVSVCISVDNSVAQIEIKVTTGHSNFPLHIPVYFICLMPPPPPLPPGAPAYRSL